MWKRVWFHVNLLRHSKIAFRGGWLHFYFKCCNVCLMCLVFMKKVPAWLIQQSYPPRLRDQSGWNRLVCSSAWEVLAVRSTPLKRPVLSFSKKWEMTSAIVNECLSLLLIAILLLLVCSLNWWVINHWLLWLLVTFVRTTVKEAQCH